MRLLCYSGPDKRNKKHLRIAQNLGAFVQPLLKRKAVSRNYIFWICVCIPRYPVCNTHAPNCHLWLSGLYSIFPHFPIKDTIFEMNILHEVSVLIFSTELSESLWGIEWDMIKNVYWYFLKYSLYLTDSC
jgi:hypothetical protein